MTTPNEATQESAAGSVDALIALARKGMSTDVPHAAPFFGVGANRAYELIQTGDWPTRVLRMGKKIRIPVAGIAEALGVDLAELTAPRPVFEDPEMERRFREDQAGWRRRIDAARRSSHCADDPTAPYDGKWTP